MITSTTSTEQKRLPTLINMTYVSDSRLPVQTQAKEIEVLVDRARRSNEIAGITGALLFTGKRFAQTLEGSAIEVDALMARVMRDERHEAIVVIDRHEVAARVFRGWSLAYSGPSVSLSRLVERALRGALGKDQFEVNRLLRLIQEFGRPGR